MMQEMVNIGYYYSNIPNNIFTILTYNDYSSYFYFVIFSLFGNKPLSGVYWRNVSTVWYGKHQLYDVHHFNSRQQSMNMKFVVCKGIKINFWLFLIIACIKTVIVSCHYVCYHISISPSKLLYQQYDILKKIVANNTSIIIQTIWTFASIFSFPTCFIHQWIGSKIQSSFPLQSFLVFSKINFGVFFYKRLHS